MNPMAYYAKTDKEWFPGYSDYEKDRPGTTFYADFRVAEPFGMPSIKETYGRVLNEWGRNAKYWTEVTLVLNQLCWIWNGHSEEWSKRGNADNAVKCAEISKLYSDLYYAARAHGDETFTDEADSYHFNGVLD